MHAGYKKDTDEKGNKLIPCLACYDKFKFHRYFHQLATHLKTDHAMSADDYKSKFAGAEILSQHTKDAMARARALASKPKAVEAHALATATLPKTPEVLHFGVATLAIREELTELEQRLVPPNDDEYNLDGLEPKLELLALGLQQNDNVMLVGPTGCGKTSLVDALATIINQPRLRLNLNNDIRAADFVGEKLVDVDTKTGQAVVVWKDGILPNAMRNGYWLLVDEFDVCPAGIAFVLQAVLEGKPLVLSSNNGEIVEPHPNFRIIATANTIGKGDDSGLYTGTNVMNAATLDRFGTVIQFDYPKKDQEAKILVDKSKIDLATAEKMVEAAYLVRQGFAKEECYCSFSTRRLIRWAQKTVALRGGTPKGQHWKAAEVTIFNKLSKDDRKYVEGIVQRHLGRT